MKKALSIVFIILIALVACSKKEEDGSIKIDQEVDVEEYKKSLKPLTDMTILIVVAHKDFDEIEFASTKNMLLSQGADIEVASTKKGEVFSDHKHPIQADLSLKEVDVSKYKGIVFVGGIGAEDDYFNNSTAHNLIREANEQGIILGASSISPAIFANAGVLKGKKATVYDDEEGADRKIFSQNGVEYTGDPVTVDGNIVTCNHRKNIKQFASTFAKQLSE